MKKIIVILFIFTCFLPLMVVNASNDIVPLANENNTNAETTEGQDNNQTEENGEASEEKDNNNTDESSEKKQYFFDKNCTDIAPALRIGNLVIRLIRMVVPLIIIILGIIGTLSPILAGSPTALGKHIIKLAIQVVIAVLIFFTPSIVNSFVSVMTKDSNSDIDVCRACLFENNCPEESEPWYKYNQKKEAE